MPFIPHTEDDVEEMLSAIGVDSIKALFDEIPEHIQVADIPELGAGLSEMALMRLMSERAEQDKGLKVFVGAGAYEHHVPAAAWSLVTRGEFYTAYTPYQAEASQGTLQLIYEYQTMMANLTAMDVSNATVYDGASGLAEAVLMAVRANRSSKSRRILMPATVHPFYRQVVRTIVESQSIELIELPFNDEGVIDGLALSQWEGQDIAAMVIPQPGFFGNLEDVHSLTNWAHQQKALVIGVVNPVSLALLTPPGEWGELGADIVCGEGQPLGIPLSSGGPYFGFMCCTQKLVRQMPGRIIGRTVDLEGKDGFVLTLQAREQHIRRSKATSNICTNQGLAMAAATVYMSMLGARGLSEVARASHQNLQYLIEQVCALDGVSQRFGSANFHEVALKLSRPANEVVDAMADLGFVAGFDLGSEYPNMKNSLLVCVTETKTRDDVDDYVQAMRKVLVYGDGSC